MSFIVENLERAGRLYARWFGDWMHVHFIVRTVLLLLVIWLVVFLVATLFRYCVGPLILLVLCHTVFRAWNFLFVETPQELIYIRQNSKGVPNYSNLYLRFTDKAKRNREILDNFGFLAALKRAKRFGMQAMILCLIAATLWVAGFGLYHEFVFGVPAPYQGGAAVLEPQEPDESEYESGYDDANDAPPEEAAYFPGIVTPDGWFIGDDIVFILNETGRLGARLHDGPGITGRTVIEILWDDVELVYLNFYERDPYVDGLYWLRVLTPGDRVGYVSSMLVEVLD